jgi:hypothetical protein
MSGGTQSRGRMSTATWSRLSCTSAGARRCRCSCPSRLLARKCIPVVGLCHRLAPRHAHVLSPAAVPQHAAQLPALSLHPGPVVDFWRRVTARGAHVFWARGGVPALFGSVFSRTSTEIRDTTCARGYPRTDAHTCACVYANTTLGTLSSHTSHYSSFAHSAMHVLRAWAGLNVTCGGITRHF